MWAEAKLRECIDILRKRLRAPKSKVDAIDLADKALWSSRGDVRDARGYLEAWADIGDMTVSEFIAFVENGQRFNLVLGKG